MKNGSIQQVSELKCKCWW